MRFVEEIAELWGDKVFLAFTNHPLNIARIDNNAVERMVATYGDCARMYLYKTPLDTPTSAFLARHAQAMLVGDSKMFALAGAHGLPIISQSNFRTGEWLNAYNSIDAFLETPDPNTPDPRAARVWFAFHAANNLINLADPDFTAADFLARLDKPIDPSRWARNFAFYSQGW